MNRKNIISIQTKNSGRQIAAAADSILGSRKEQQDFAGLVVEKNQVLAVVCDGMGGLEGGALASSSAVELLVSDYQEQRPEAGFTEFLSKEAIKMDQCVAMQTNQEGTLLRGGCTMAAVIVSDGLLYWLSVGDSRIYVLRGDSMVLVTRDHNYLRELEEALGRGEITKDYYESELLTKRTDALTNYIGMGGIRRMERNANPLELMDGDMILLCSDGLYKRLEEDQIKAMIVDNQISVQVAVRRLNRMVMDLTVKGQDNTTVVLIQYHAPSEPLQYQKIQEEG